MRDAESFNQKLNHAFEIASRKDFITPHGKHGQNVINYGNQPSTHTAHLFNYSGTPWLTQKWVREVYKKTFSGITPNSGYGGDEDQGEMGSLSALMAMGLFKVRGGSAQKPIYEITSPVFNKITIHFDQNYYPGKRLSFLPKTIRIRKKIDTFNPSN